MSIQLPVEIPKDEDRLIVDAAGHELAEAPYVEYAEFIVRAVNSHDDLLAALRFERQIQEGNDAEAYPQFMAMRDKAIAKAGEGQP